jgi:hypothetical protein
LRLDIGGKTAGGTPAPQNPRTPLCTEDRRVKSASAQN